MSFHRRIVPILALALLVLSGVACGFGANPAQQRANDNRAVTGNAQVGDIVTARGIGQGNAPLNPTNQFNSSEDVIYAVSRVSVKAGTTMFARWYYNGQPDEDTNQITADRDYTNTYVEFHIQPTRLGGLRSGRWRVEFFVNGNPVKSADFTVR